MTMARAVVTVGLLIVSVAVVRTQNATFSSRVEAVRVDVLVTDNGQFVGGLGPRDFDVRDNGVEQRVDLVGFEELPLNVVLALDMSESVAGDRLVNLRAAGGAVLAGLMGDDQAALVTFSHIVELGSGLTKNVQAIRTALSHASGSGDTALIDGTYAGMTFAASDARRTLLIVFSDGLDTSSWLSADRVLDAARRSDVVAYGVTVAVAGEVRVPVRPRRVQRRAGVPG